MYTFRALGKERHLSDSSNYVFAGAELLNRQLPITVTHRISLSSSNTFALHSGNSSFESLGRRADILAKIFRCFSQVCQENFDIHVEITTLPPS